MHITSLCLISAFFQSFLQSGFNLTVQIPQNKSVYWIFVAFPLSRGKFLIHAREIVYLLQHHRVSPHYSSFRRGRKGGPCGGTDTHLVRYLSSLFILGKPIHKHGLSTLEYYYLAKSLDSPEKSLRCTFFRLLISLWLYPTVPDLAQVPFGVTVWISHYCFLVAFLWFAMEDSKNSWLGSCLL